MKLEDFLLLSFLQECCQEQENNSQRDIEEETLFSSLTDSQRSLYNKLKNLEIENQIEEKRKLVHFIVRFYKNLFTK